MRGEIVKRLVASRKLKRTCLHCDREINKGEVYYKKREVYAEQGEKIITYEYLVCPKCKYETERNTERFKKFKQTCNHKEKFIDTHYTYIPGECTMEPSYEYCRLCGSTV